MALLSSKPSHLSFRHAHTHLFLPPASIYTCKFLLLTEQTVSHVWSQLPLVAPRTASAAAFTCYEPGVLLKQCWVTSMRFLSSPARPLCCHFHTRLFHTDVLAARHRTPSCSRLHSRGQMCPSSLSTRINLSV